MATNENLIPIPGRLHSVATEGHVAGADEIIDDNLGKDQQTINAEVNAALGEGGTVDEKIAEAIDDALEDVAFIDDSESSPAVVPGFDPTTDTVHVTAQTLSETQKAQVRTNIGLGDVDAKINQAVASEASQRTAADSSLQSNINAEATVRANAVSAETSRATSAENTINQKLQLLNGCEVVVVADHTQVSSPDSQKIYREIGTSSYTDWMYQDSAWKQIATYNPGIDDEPTAGSDNLVRSGGIFANIGAFISKTQTLTPPTSGSRTLACNLYPNVRYRLVRVLGTATSATKYPAVSFDGTIVKVLNADKSQESDYFSIKDSVDFYVKEYANGFGVYFDSSSDVYTITSIPADDRISETNKVVANLQRSFSSQSPIIANNVLKKVQIPGGLRMINNGATVEIAASNTEIAYNWKASNASNIYLTYNLSTKTFAFDYSWNNFTNKLLICNFYCSGSSDDNTCNMLGIISSVVDFRINNSNNNARHSGYYYGEKIDVSKHKYLINELFRLNSFSGTISNLTNISTQGFDIYDDRYLFQASSYSLADRGIIIADLNNKSILGSINMGGDVEFHFNNVNCGAKYNSADKFPLLYMSDNSYLKQCIVGRIADTADSITTVQTISYSGTHLANTQINWTIDVDNKYIYAYGVVVNGSTSKESSTEILKFALPSLESSSIVLTDADIIDSTIYIGLRANQGAKVMNDKFYSPNGLYTDAYPSILQVVDMTTKEIVSELSLNSVGEPEGIAFYNDVIIINNASDVNAKYMAYAT